MAVLPVIMATQAAVGLVNTAISAGKAYGMRQEIEGYKDALDSFERQPIPDFSKEIQDLSGQLTNPYANLGVATKAAEIQAEQTDLALANTLDTLRATGAGAGGATALARAAAQSKVNIAASIQSQEAQNQKLSAQGEASLQQARMTEQQRVQQARANAQLQAFNIAEKREETELDRLQAQYDNAVQQQNQYRQDAMSALGGTVSSVASSYMGGLEAGVFGQDDPWDF
jgi:hypothetical protein